MRDPMSLARRDEPMARHTTFRFGGPADYFVEPRNADELALALDTCREQRLETFPLGMGSNLLVRDAGVRGAVIYLGGLEPGRMTREGRKVVASAGVKLPKLLRFACDQGLAGLEALIGIPGTVGGAVVMNAGGRYGTIGEFVTCVHALDRSGAAVRIGGAEAGFGNRTSNLGPYLVTAVELELPPGEPPVLAARAQAILAEKKKSQPLSAKSAGCVFKNPPGQSAGRLIDEAGLKGHAVGGAMVSHKHANFIVNRGDARAADVLELIELIRERVRSRFQISLELEVKVW